MGEMWFGQGEVYPACDRWSGLSVLLTCVYSVALVQEETHVQLRVILPL